MVGRGAVRPAPGVGVQSWGVWGRGVSCWVCVLRVCVVVAAHEGVRAFRGEARNADARGQGASWGRRGVLLQRRGARAERMEAAGGRARPGTGSSFTDWGATPRPWVLTVTRRPRRKLPRARGGAFGGGGRNRSRLPKLPAGPAAGARRESNFGATVVKRGPGGEERVRGRRAGAPRGTPAPRPSRAIGGCRGTKGKRFSPHLGSWWGARRRPLVEAGPPRPRWACVREGGGAHATASAATFSATLAGAGGAALTAAGAARTGLPAAAARSTACAAARRAMGTRSGEHDT
jgi:hypothetical protein